MLEGGGQILRNAAALSAITATPIKVTKIRAGRSKPGLRAQHLAGLQLVAEICQGELQGGEIGSKEISLHPRHITSGHHLADTKTAGSCMLLAQVCTHASKLYKNFSCMDTQCKDIFLCKHNATGNPVTALWLQWHLRLRTAQCKDNPLGTQNSH